MGKKKKKISFFRWTKKSKYTAALIILIILVIGAFSIVSSAERSYQIEYTVSPEDIANKLLKVNVRLKPIGNLRPHQFVLVKGNMKSKNESCVDDKGNKVNFGEEKGFVVVDELPEGASYIDYSYDVELARLGKHGFNSEVYGKMLSFEGEAVLAMPLAAVDEKNKKADKVDSIKVECMVPDIWEGIIPFKSKDSNRITEIEKPTWFDMYEIRKSTYTFGNFQKEEHMTKDGGYTIFVDPEAKKYYTEDTKRGIASLYNYYAELFNYKLKNYSIVLLRTEGKDNQYIIGGASSQNMASTFNPENSRDWQLMGHRLFHAFFEASVPLDKFNKAPMLNFYEGLATYYENMSMRKLPEDLKNRLSIYPEKEFGELFERYVYMKLKSPETLNFAPAQEAALALSPARLEFLHYTQSPLLVKCIEDNISKVTSKEDNALHYILANKDEKNLTVESILNSLMGKEGTDFINKYIKGTEIVPLWDLAKSSDGDNREVINRLNDYEYLLYTWFFKENQVYVSDVLVQDKLIKISEEAERRGIKFASDELEQKIKSTSPTMYNLLKEYALRAKICAVELGDPYLREKLLSNKENVAKWEEFVKAVK